jgi:hypothetical protein
MPDTLERIREILYPNIDGPRFWGHENDVDVNLGTLPNEQWRELRKLLGFDQNDFTNSCKSVPGGRA